MENCRIQRLLQALSINAVVWCLFCRGLEAAASLPTCEYQLTNKTDPKSLAQFNDLNCLDSKTNRTPLVWAVDTDRADIVK